VATGTRTKAAAAPKGRTKAAPAKKAPVKKGLSVKTFKGINKKRLEGRGGANAGKRVILKAGDTLDVQFLQNPDDFSEYEQHGWRDGNQWTFVPCLGDGCPLCEEESDEIRRTSYKAVANVYNIKEKKVQVLEMGRDLAGRVFYRYEKAPAKFTKRTFEVTRFPTQPVTYDVAVGEEPAVKTTGLTLIDLDEYILEEAKRYHGADMPTASALDDDEDDDDEDLDDEEEDEDDEDLDDDDEDEEEDEDDEDEEEDDLDDEEDDDEDDDDDDDDDEEDEDDEPAPAPSRARRAAAASKSKSAPVKSKSTPVKKAAPAKKATARRR
jgi:hypothetical protein